MVQSNLDRITTDVFKLNNQISSGLQMSKISDDPVNLVSALRFRSSIVELDQYSENITLGETTIAGSESALREMKELVIRAKELTIQAINAGLTSSEHTALASEIKNIHEQAVMLANTQVNGKYIFGGYRTTGYTDKEPSPFIIDKGDGHWINGTIPATAVSIPANTLKINGFTIDASVDDGISSIDADASAAAKAAAINAATNGQTVGGVKTPGTGVSAEVVPASLQGAAAVSPGTINAGEFLINGIDIGPVTTAAGDTDHALADAINTATANTGVKATRNSAGEIILTAVDGRNIEVQDASGLTGLTPGVAYGSIQLRSDRVFTLESTVIAGPPIEEPGFAALGLTGGEAGSGEPGDLADDGKISVSSIHDRIGTVRYAGDRENDLEIKIGKVEKMVIGENGQTGVAETDIFTALKKLEDALRKQNFTSVTSINKAADTSALLNSGATGLAEDLENPLANGTFTVIVTDHDYNPPVQKTITIGIDPAVDSLEDVSQRIDGVANISASWNADGELQITSDNPGRYTFAFKNDSSNFLSTVGVDEDAMQFNGLEQSLTNLDHSLDSLSDKVSSFGAKGNRIDVQAQIYSGLQIAAKENLSDVQDTDLIKAIMDLKAKEVAYQATLASAAKTMQLSLVDYL
jgi:flagellar hook-associated protein 3 FlgL